MQDQGTSAQHSYRTYIENFLSAVVGNGTGSFHNNPNEYYDSFEEEEDDDDEDYEDDSSYEEAIAGEGFVDDEEDEYEEYEDDIDIE